MDSGEKVSRVQARAVACPVCGAKPEQRCVGARGRPRESNHKQRIEAARTALIENPHRRGRGGLPRPRPHAARVRAAAALRGDRR